MNRIDVMNEWITCALHIIVSGQLFKVNGTRPDDKWRKFEYCKLKVK